jgi:hypothetical protein
MDNFLLYVAIAASFWLGFAFMREFINVRGRYKKPAPPRNKSHEGDA